MKKTISIVVCLLCLSTVLVSCRRPNDDLTVSGLKEHFDPELYKTQSVIIGEDIETGIDHEKNEEYSEDVEILSEMLCLEEWVETKKGINEKLRLTIDLEELYEIRIYDSYIEVYDGYTATFQKMYAYYKVTDNMNEKINAYIETKNILTELL